MTTAVIYARVSDRKQAEEDVSVPSQVEAARAKAEELGATVLRVFTDEGRSGYRESTRPGFDAAMDLAVTYPATYFIVWSSSRFARNRVDATLRKVELDKAGVKLVYITTPIDRDTDSGFILDSVMEMVDELRSRQIGADTRRSMISNARAGFFCGGVPPFGYSSQPAPDNPKRRVLVVNDYEAKIVREIFDLRLKGLGGKGIAAALNARGELNRGARWSTTTVLSMLRAESVIGQTVFNRKNRKTMRMNPRDTWLVVQSHSPIVDADTWAAVQSMIDAAADRCTHGSPNSTHAFTGILRCGRCGAGMQIETAKGRSARYSYYNCRNAMRASGCENRRLPAPAVDDYLIDVIMDRVLSPANLRDVVQSIQAEYGRAAAARNRERGALVQRLREIQARNSKLYDVLELHGRDAPNLADLTQRMRDNNAAIKSIEQQVRALDERVDPELTIDAGSVASLGDYLRTLLKAEGNAARTRAFFGGFIRGIVAHADRFTIEYDTAKLIAQASPVHSAEFWLPESCVLRTLDVPMVQGTRMARGGLRLAAG